MARTFRQKKRCIRIGVDFDGVIAPYEEDFQGPGVFGPPIPGAIAGMKALAENGYQLIINTCRGEEEAIDTYLRAWDIPFHGINRHDLNSPKGFIANKHKIFCDIYLDDRGLQFNGDWAATVNAIESFILWYKREGTKFRSIGDKVGYGSDYETLLDHATGFIQNQAVPFINSLLDKASQEDNPIQYSKLERLKIVLESLVGLMECS